MLSQLLYSPHGPTYFKHVCCIPCAPINNRAQRSCCLEMKYTSHFLCVFFTREKEEIWLSPMTKAPTPAEMSKWQNKQRHKKVPITQWLRTDLGRPNLPTPRNSLLVKRTHIYKFVNKPPYIDNKPTATPSGEVIKIDTRTAYVINIIYQKYI